jgi:hypothetical protein
MHQDPVAEAPAGLVEAAEGQGTDDAVDGETAFLLEGAHGELDPIVEARVAGGGVLSRIAQKTDPMEKTGDLGDCGT